MSYRFARTAAGQAEIQSRTLNLPRPVRNLLLILNASQTGSHWISQVKGCTEEDISRLLAEGLIEPVADPVPTSPPRASTAATAVAAAPLDYQGLQRHIREADYATLYEALNAFSKQALGLVRGYRFALEIEKCSGPQELQDLALRYIERVRAEQGPEPLRRFSQMLTPH